MLSWGFWTRRTASIPSSPATPPEDDEMPIPHHRPQPQISDEDVERVRFTTSCAVVTAWLSDGGVLIKIADAVDLQHLGVSRLEPTARPVPFDPAQEDIWAAQVRQIAPKWYRSVDDYYRADVGERFATPRETEKIFMGWPSTGGLWVLRFADGHPPSGFGRISVCVNMDERCEVLKKFGAQYYESADDCFELSQAYIDDCRRQRDADDLGWGDEN